MKKITVKGTNIRVITIHEHDYISLTDMVEAGGGAVSIPGWLHKKKTMEYLGMWEKIHNPDFNDGEFVRIKRQVRRRTGKLQVGKGQTGSGSNKISIKEWITRTRAVGIRTKTGRYPGIFARKDIAFEFGLWISPEFKIHLIDEFQRLKEEEKKQLGRDIQRNLTKMNYRLHTRAIKENLVSPDLDKSQVRDIYASEADILNMALLGTTAALWRETNPDKKGNIRDHTDSNQRLCLANLESLNALFINEGLSQEARLKRLNKIAARQMSILTGDSSNKRL